MYQERYVPADLPYANLTEEITNSIRKQRDTHTAPSSLT